MLYFCFPYFSRSNKKYTTYTNYAPHYAIVQNDKRLIFAFSSEVKSLKSRSTHLSTCSDGNPSTGVGTFE